MKNLVLGKIFHTQLTDRTAWTVKGWVKVENQWEQQHAEPVHL